VCLSKELAGAYFDYGKAMNHLQKMLHHLRSSCRWRSQLGNISWTVARDPVRSVTHGSVWEVGGDHLTLAPSLLDQSDHITLVTW
jgi:hypothetical protein